LGHIGCRGGGGRRQRSGRDLGVEEVLFFYKLKKYMKDRENGKRGDRKKRGGKGNG